ncbi:MAG TPA: alpha/beta fold hydrolase [Longimicrobium sp.]|nr:alpha/beta fold hydrolase [Longimicrobium sp.]
MRAATVRGYGERLAPWAERLGARVRVLVAHGAGNDAVYPLLELFRGLLRAGAEVFAFDLDGHGCSSTTVFAPDTVRTAVAAAAEAAERGRPPLPLHVIGHSLGGSLVLDALAAGQLDHAVSAAILSAPVDVRIGARTVVGELRGFFRRGTLAQREHYGWWGLVPAFGPIKRAAYPFRRMDADGRAWSYVDAVRRLLAEMELERRVAHVTVPTLLVYSYADRLVPMEQGIRLASGLRRPYCGMHLSRTASHYGLAFDPEVVERVVNRIAFFQRHPEAA